MGEVFRFKSLKFKIWPKDHLPPHVHVIGPDGHAKVNIETLEVIFSEGFSAKDILSIQQQIFKRKIKILEKWEHYHGKNKTR
jgi:hypothetical protein